MSKTRKSILSKHLRRRRTSFRRKGHRKSKHVRFMKKHHIIRGGSNFFPPTVGGNMPPLPTGSFYPFSQNTGGNMDPTTPSNVLSDRNIVG